MIYEYSRVAVKATGAAQDNTVAGTLNPDILLQIENLPRRKIPGPLSSRKRNRLERNCYANEIKYCMNNNSF